MLACCPARVCAGGWVALVRAGRGAKLSFDITSGIHSSASTDVLPYTGCRYSICLSAAAVLVINVDNAL